MSKKTELEKVQAAPLVPSFIDQSSSKGKENIEREDVTLPRIRLCQAMSPERKKSDPGFIEGLEEGQFFQKNPDTIYGSSLVVLPLIMNKSQIYFRGLDQGGGIICQAPDGKHGTVYGECSKCEHQMWPKGQSGVPPACTQIYNFICLLPNFENDLTVVSLKSSATKAARSWNAMIMHTPGEIYGHLYKISAVEEKNSKGTFFNYRVKFYVSDPDPDNRGSYPLEALFKFADKLFQELSTKTVAIETDDEVEAKQAIEDNVPF